MPKLTAKPDFASWEPKPNYLTWWGLSINEGGNNTIYLSWAGGMIGFYLCVMGKSIHWLKAYK